MARGERVQWFRRDAFDPPTLLRRVDGLDEAFRDGSWHPTNAIIAAMVGQDLYVTKISEDEAREIAPAAFAS